MAESLRPAIYARQSLDIKDSLSIEGQIEVCRAMCAGGPEPLVYADKGYSGKNTERPQFKKLMADVRQGKISRIVCYRLDRVSRSIVDFGRIWEELSSHGVEFSSSMDRFDTGSPTGRAMLYIIMVFAQLERETISARVHDNYYQRSRRGMWPGGPAPYGFRIAKNPDGPGKMLLPADALSVVPQIFEQYVAFGASLGTVARRLDQQGVPSPRRTTWDSASVGRVLRHPAYVRADASVYAYYKRRGVILANDIEEYDGAHGCQLVGKRDANDRKYTNVSNHVLALCSHEGVVSSELFLSVQRKLDSNKQIGNTGHGMLSWLSGLLKCAACGYSLAFQGGSGPYRLKLKCSGHYNLHVCDELQHSDIREVEDRVLREMHVRLSSMFPDDRRPTDSRRVSALQAAASASEAKISNLISSLSEATPLTMSYINAEIARLEEEKQAALDALLDLDTSASSLRDAALLDLSTLDFNEKRTLANMMIARILLSDRSLKIDWKV